MKSAKIIATCLVLVAGTIVGPVAYAQDSGGGPKGSPDGGPGNRIERFCSTDGAKRVADWEERSLDRMDSRLKLTDAQKTAFKDLQDTRAKARTDAKSALCANKPDLTTFSGRLTFRQSMAEQHLATLKATSPKLLAFYNSLDADQKAKFDKAQERRWHHRHRGWRDDGGRDRGHGRHHHRHHRDR